MLPKFIFSGCILILFFAGCVPVNSCFDSARMLQKNQLQVRINYSDYNYIKDRESDPSNYNYGLGAAYGFSEAFNLKFRYELITFPDNSTDFYHYFDIAPKYSIIPNILAAQLPIGVYAADGIKPSFVMSPHLFATWPMNDHFESTFSVKTDIEFEEDADIPVGFMLGLGLSKNLNMWALRPEIGYMINTDQKESSFTFGVGFNFNFELLN